MWILCCKPHTQNPLFWRPCSANTAMKASGLSAVVLDLRQSKPLRIHVSKTCSIPSTSDMLMHCFITVIFTSQIWLWLQYFCTAR